MTDQPEAAEREQHGAPSRNIPYPTPELSPSSKQKRISSPDVQPTSALKRRRSSPSAPAPEDDLGERRIRRSKRRRTDDRPAAIPDVSRRSPLPSTTRSRAPKPSRPLTKRKPKRKPRASELPPSHTSQRATSRRRAASNPLPHTVPPRSAPSELDWYTQSFDESTFSMATPPPVGTPLDPTEQVEVTVSNIAPLPSPPPSISDTLRVTRSVAGSVTKVVDITPAEGEATHRVAFPSSSPLLERHTLPTQDLGWIKVGELTKDREPVVQDPVSSALLFGDDLVD